MEYVPGLLFFHHSILSFSYFLYYYLGGNLLSYVMDTSDPWPEDKCQFYGAEILLALEHIHNQNIVYKYVIL